MLLASLGAMGLYAACGSTMDPAQMLRRGPSSPFAGTGRIPGRQLTFGAAEAAGAPADYLAGLRRRDCRSITN
jgi:hypothetical protein